MTKIPPGLRAVTVREWIGALERDGFQRVKKAGGHLIFRHPDGRMVPVTYHRSSDTFRPKTLKSMLTQAGWGEADLRRLGLLR
jgi:predicted RNA binding protein YcfA (HicA-like mRNA interferase family)